ncbi:MAG: translation elongation factor Ts [Verrucomicrobia bacterium]|nr:translation elongation factor Ts [Verrucomicrobiota bacterium]MDA1064896.1 translation elongation factor Ts [Verrucomicrobiota bacterium]
MSVQITASMVNDLRQKTGVGLMDCKRALVESEGDLEKAITALRKKGVSTAEKKAGRAASEGLIEQYIHMGGKVGVLIELNCETDFVAKTDDFKALAKDICLHVAAANPSFLRREQVSEELTNQERDIAIGQAEGKPPQAVEKIVEGKLDKFYSQICLIEQPFIKDPAKTVKELINEKISQLGENIVIRRFSRYQLGQ